MSRPAQLTRTDRAYRRQRIVSAYIDAKRGGSRAVAASFGVSDSYVRAIVREAGVARRPGNPG